MTELLRVLTLDEAHHEHAVCAWWSRAEPNCQQIVLCRLATPNGELDYCRDHISPAVASLPREWLDGFEYREPAAVDSGDDIPF